MFCRHSTPKRLLSDSRKNFLSELIQVLDVTKLNTLGYYPQTDGLGKTFNSTLINTVSECSEKNGRDWDKHLPFPLFAYWANIQHSTYESPFLLLRHLSAYWVSTPLSNYSIHDHLGWLKVICNLADSSSGEYWKCSNTIKTTIDKHIKEVGDRVMMHMTDQETGKVRKLSKPFLLRALHSCGNDTYKRWSLVSRQTWLCLNFCCTWQSLALLSRNTKQILHGDGVDSVKRKTLRR